MHYALLFKVGLQHTYSTCASRMEVQTVYIGAVTELPTACAVALAPVLYCIYCSAAALPVLVQSSLA
jgi:hypothetical protein